MIMSDLPKMKYLEKKINMTFKLDEATVEIYRIGRQNGWDVSELVRQILAEAFAKRSEKLKQPANSAS